MGSAARGVTGVFKIGGCGGFGGALAGFVSTGVGLIGALVATFSRSAGFGAGRGVAGSGGRGELAVGVVLSVFVTAGLVSICTNAVGFVSTFAAMGFGAGGIFTTGAAGFVVSGFASCVATVFSTGLFITGSGRLSLRSVACWAGALLTAFAAAIFSTAVCVTGLGGASLRSLIC